MTVHVCLLICCYEACHNLMIILSPKYTALSIYLNAFKIKFIQACLYTVEENKLHERMAINSFQYILVNCLNRDHIDTLKIKKENVITI